MANEKRRRNGGQAETRRREVEMYLNRQESRKKGGIRREVGNWRTRENTGERQEMREKWNETVERRAK